MLTQDNDQIQQRHLHLEEISRLGHPAYPHRFDWTHTISKIVESYHGYAGKREDEAEAASVNAELQRWILSVVLDVQQMLYDGENVHECVIVGFHNES